MVDFRSDPRFGRTWRRFAFRLPIGRDHDERLLLWRPGVKPQTAYRRRASQTAIMREWALIILLSAIPMAGAAYGLTLSFTGRWGWAILVFIGVLFVGSTVSIYLSADRKSTRKIRELRRGWDYHCDDVKVFDPQGSTGSYGTPPTTPDATELVGLLEDIQYSRAAAAGIVSSDRIAELHRHVWALVNSTDDLTDDVAALKRVVDDIRETDALLLARDRYEQAAPTRAARQALEGHTAALSEELKLFREFIQNRHDENGHA